jgi:hypothetical protein
MIHVTLDTGNVVFFKNYLPVLIAGKGAGQLSRYSD